MIIGIDASNIRDGGGVSHLAELLKAASPGDHGFSRIVVWGGASTLARLPEAPWLDKRHESVLDRSLPHRAFWQTFVLGRRASSEHCDVLFIPGGTAVNGFAPRVLMSQNLLPFEWTELRRYGFSPFSLKMLLLRISQSRSFRRAQGVIFLTNYARRRVLDVTGAIRGSVITIPHGINSRFSREPRPQKEPAEFNKSAPFRVLYVSVVDLYKHQWHVADAVAQLRASGIPLMLELVGPAGAGMSRLQQTLNRLDPEGTFITYRGRIPHAELAEVYAAADLGVFASSCETFGLILLEAMKAGLPVLSSDRSALPEVLGDAGRYFDPEDPESIANAILTVFQSSQVRAKMARAAVERSQHYSWRKCANETFGFLGEIARAYQSAPVAGVSRV